MREGVLLVVRTGIGDLDPLINPRWRDAFRVPGGAALAASADRVKWTWGRARHQPAPSPDSGSGFLSQAAEFFRASARNCRIRCAASRHRSPAALLDEGATVPRRGNLVECDEFCCG